MSGSPPGSGMAIEVIDDEEIGQTSEIREVVYAG